MMMTSLLDAGVCWTNTTKLPEVVEETGQCFTVYGILRISIHIHPNTPSTYWGHAFLRSYEGAGDEEEYMYTNYLLTVDDLSDEDYSLSDDE